MRPSLQFSVPCLEVKEENKPPSFVYLFYELPFPSFPVQSPPFFINNGWCHGKGIYHQRIRILDPEKNSVIVETESQDFTLKEPYTPQMMINLFDGVVFEKPGHYWIQSFLDEELVLEYPLTVRKAEMDADAGS